MTKQRKPENRVTVRLTDEERDALRRLRQAWACSTSEALRRALLICGGQWLPPTQTTEEQQMIMQSSLDLARWARDAHDAGGHISEHATTNLADAPYRLGVLKGLNWGDDWGPWLRSIPEREWLALIDTCYSETAVGIADQAAHECLDAWRRESGDAEGEFQLTEQDVEFIQGAVEKEIGRKATDAELREAGV
jgi:Arc/MetJ-type ribon-helix-helix transcriptional regulator